VAERGLFSRETLLEQAELEPRFSQEVDRKMGALEWAGRAEPIAETVAGAPAIEDTQLQQQRLGPPSTIGRDAARVRCREISPPDLEAIVQLLTRGFGVRSCSFWRTALRRLGEHVGPSGYPKYGYLLESGGVPVGVILLIFTSISQDGETSLIRCSVSSWYTEPSFSGYASMLALRASKFKNVTYFNITPHPRTFAMLPVQGYSRYCEGRIISIPLSHRGPRGVHVSVISADTLDAGCVAGCVERQEVDLLRSHAEYGCVCVVCTVKEQRYPFVFLPSRIMRLVRSAHLAYCRDISDFVRFAGPLGRFLARLGIVVVELDANGPVQGLRGVYLGGAPKYFKGPQKPRLGDIAYSERVMFGF
jgi:hypothetical protein